MKHSNASSAAILARASELGEPRPMRRGSITERRICCSKPGCACKEDPDARHGPYFSLTRAVHGVTQTRLLTAAQAEVVRHQIEAGREFRDAAEVYWQACEREADEQLAAVVKEAADGAEKKGSRRHLPSRSGPRSKRS